jgi:cobalamin synthase
MVMAKNKKKVGKNKINEINLMVRFPFPTFRFMEMMRDCWAVPLCGLFLLLLSGMCLVAFSAVTVKYYIHFSHTKAIVTIIITCTENVP